MFIEGSLCASGAHLVGEDEQCLRARKRVADLPQRLALLPQTSPPTSLQNIQKERGAAVMLQNSKEARGVFILTLSSST